MKDLNGNNYDYDKAATMLLKKYSYAVDSITDIRCVSDHLNYLYQNGGEQAVDDWFTPYADDEYKRDYKALVLVI